MQRKQKLSTGEKTSRNTWLDTNKKLNKILTRYSIDTPGISFMISIRDLLYFSENCIWLKSIAMDPMNPMHLKTHTG